MDNSQDSEVFSSNSAHEEDINYVKKYAMILARLESDDVFDFNLKNPTKLSDDICLLLEDCNNFIHQALDFISKFLIESVVELSVLHNYLENVVAVLRGLTNFVRRVDKTKSLCCSSMNKFPTMGGQILLCVFIHCKESENLYGNNLEHLQNDLKELFRKCHELQLTYLKIIERQLFFDLSDTNELYILIEALNINLKIGEIVESLDLKTMAEQWKSYTIICEKYISHLSVKIYEDCSGTIYQLTSKNLCIAFEDDQDQKVVLRSLKLSNFLIKILIKITHIFKKNSGQYANVIKLLIEVYRNNIPYLLYHEKSPQFINLVINNTINAADTLLLELLSDEKFALSILNSDVSILSKDESLLGYMVALINIIKHVIQANDTIKEIWMDCESCNLVNCVFNVLPHAYPWFYLGLKFPPPVKTGSIRTHGLYEHLLTYVVALVSTFDMRRYCEVEQKMYELLLSSDGIVAKFVTDLWILLAKKSSRQLKLNLLTQFCKIYLQLEKNHMFSLSPQQIHLSRFIELLFKSLTKEDKLNIYKQFNIQNEDYMNLWSVLKLRNLPLKAQNEAEEFIIDQLKSKLNENSSNTDITFLIKAIKLASTCTFMKIDIIENEVISAWLQLCLKNSQMCLFQGGVFSDTLWCLEYLTALCSLTETMIPVLQRNSEGTIKVLHVIYNMMLNGNVKTKLIIQNLIFKLALYNSPDNIYKQQIDKQFNNIFKEMFKENNTFFQNKLYETIRSYSNNGRIRDIITKAAQDEYSVMETLLYFQEHDKLREAKISWYEQLMITSTCHYKHICLKKGIQDNKDNEIVDLERMDTNSFEFDLDNLSNTDNVPEPAFKKVKMDSNEVESVITRLESDVSLLNKLKENVCLNEYSGRIVSICNKLNNIVK